MTRSDNDIALDGRLIVVACFNLWGPRCGVGVGRKHFQMIIDEYSRFGAKSQALLVSYALTVRQSSSSNAPVFRQSEPASVILISVSL